MNPGEAFAWLDAHVNLESTGLPVGESRRSHPTLERMEALAALLGSPQLEYPTIHLTGTNGKTSASRIATALLVASGFQTGTYTSPHLQRVNERVTWDGEEISDHDFAELIGLIAEIEPHLPAVPSYFEIVTGIALRWFADVAVQAAVVEVGVGGRWDATNVIDARVAVVTNVSVDHVEYLGPTRGEIAQEKAGIVKPDGALVLGETDPDLAATFLARGASPVWVRDREFGVTENKLAHGGRLVTLYTPYERYDEVFLSLHGAHQADNAAIAVAGVECFLERPIGADVLLDVLGTVTSPGRLEVVRHQPLVLLDGAHNVAGAASLVTALREEFPPAPRTLVVGLLREKDPREMLEALDVGAAARVICCRPPSQRARQPDEVAAVALEMGVDQDRLEVVDAVPDAVDLALELTSPDEQIVITGSLYVVGAARAILLP